MFYETEDNQIKFRLRCQHDGITQSQFFRMMVQGYISGEQTIFDFVQDKKESLAIQGKAKINKLKKIKNEESKNIKKFDEVVKTTAGMLQVRVALGELSQDQANKALQA